MKRIFWNVDTQNDFMREDGKLPVEGAKGIRGNLAQLTAYAKDNGIQVVNTADWHRDGDTEIANNPNFVDTYPEHCVADTTGAEYIAETNPENAYVIDWNDLTYVIPKITDTRNIILRKNEFDVFTGNTHANGIVELLAPEEVVVYGVATNVCVDQAVKGLRERNIDVYVVEDAIKHLPHLDDMDHPLYKGLEGTLKEWEDTGVRLVTTVDIVQNYK